MSKLYYETDDIVLAATLKVKGYKLDRIEKDGKRGTFCFADVDVSLLQEYNLGQVLVEPISMNSAIRALTTATKRL